MSCPNEQVPHVPAVIIGAGPAGLTAAAHLSERGIACAVIDEAPQVGGQIARRPFGKHFAPSAYGWARPYRRLLEANLDSELVQWRFGLTVWAVSEPGATASHVRRMRGPDGPSELPSPATSSLNAGRFRVHLAVEGVPTAALDCDYLLLAPGAYDAPLLFDDWTAPGVVGVGALQTIAKTGGLAETDQVLVYGTHPLGLIAAAEVVRQGRRISEVVLPLTPWEILADTLRFLTVPLASSCKLPQLLGALATLLQARVSITLGSRVTSVAGAERLEGVVIQASRTKNSRRVPCNVLGTGGGFFSSSELLRSLGAETVWDPDGGGWLARHDERMEATKDGVFVAGEITGVAGSESAAAEGILAAHSIAASIAPDTPAVDTRRLRLRVRRWARFGRAMAKFGRSARRRLLRLTDAHTLLCRCESVSVGDVCEAREKYPTELGMRDIKLVTRLGMGPCQGRYCGPLTCQLFPELTENESAQGQELRSRSPLKPLRVTELTKGEEIC